MTSVCAPILRQQARGWVCLSLARGFSVSAVNDARHYKVVVLGGGCGGASVAARLARTFRKGSVAVVEPSANHYYQPLWTLVGGGVKPVEKSERPMSSVLPKSCDWIKQKVQSFDPLNNMVTLNNGEQLQYDFLVVALGLNIALHKVPGLAEALTEDPMVCCNYLRRTVPKTFPAIKRMKGGNAIFTFPNTPIKCAGAPQKIMYLADDYWRKNGVRDNVNVTYNTAIGVIFGVKKYAASLMKIVEDRDIDLNLKTNLIAVDHTKHEATFENLDTEKRDVYKYDFLHVGPPFTAPEEFQNSTSSLVSPSGFLDVNKSTLQHSKFPNIFGIGDCTNVPTAKTAAAVAGQNGILVKSLKQVMKGQTPNGQYDGYTACPLLTAYDKCILAEFDFDAEPLETFPFNQGKERRTMFHLKRDVMPRIYWKLFLNGLWNGPGTFRKLIHFGMSK